MSKKATKVRWMFALIFFLIGVIAYMDRANISYIAQPMMEDLNMNKTQFGMLASVFAAGYALMQVPAGIMAEKFGPKKMLTFALVWWSAFTILTGVVKNHGLLYTMRFLFGIGEGPMYPSNAVFNTYWFAKSEKGRASSALLAGSYFGPVIAPFVTIAIYQAFGWEAVFFIFGAIGIVIAAIWAIIAKDLPEHHKMVNEAEKAYIMENRDVVQTDKKSAPWGIFFKRFSFFAIAGQYFVVQFVITLFLIWLPTYLQEEYHVVLKDMKFLAAAPWLMMFILIMAGGTISDAIISRGYSRFRARALIAIFGFIVFAVSLFLSVQTNDMMMNLIYLSLCLGGVGLSMGMSWASATDLGRNFSGTVSGWMNLWGNVGAFLSPMLGGYLVQHYGWDTTFYLMIIPAVLAIVLWFFVKPDQPLIVEEK
ncbi:MFS transporter [Macrococcoides caseolyticum]|uniref:Major facilitator superfamily (MFS) profile domain-containing protein n=1 Tax=Macrococcus caseolyticus (strain JCSC5402) TaxID=458233 RepID=B9E8I9_MACCJ|nr:MFS transporter [Macrococcus caseolyticus]ARQ05498.1 putative galactarate transporter [Macrococcus caseolyticus]MEB8171257.1 MFS transporter [Macrococcus caseolyticus]PKD99591.1 MFS transporter [Macrococcus caseolyticus]PKE07018.1 MFS transporter [Macrococcus caseolyticus]PKE17272.1 MFS transporter [Macrococcus caseolyticus]